MHSNHAELFALILHIVVNALIKVIVVKIGYMYFNREKGSHPAKSQEEWKNGAGQLIGFILISNQR